MLHYAFLTIEPFGALNAVESTKAGQIFLWFGRLVLG